MKALLLFWNRVDPDIEAFIKKYLSAIGLLNPPHDKRIGGDMGECFAWRKV